MADRFPLVLDTTDGNRVKELPSGDNLDLTGSGITGATTIEATAITIGGVSVTANDGTFAGLTAKPTTVAGYGITDAFSGNYADLTGKPSIPNNIQDLANVATGTPANGNVLVYNSTSGLFEFGPPSNSFKVAQLNDVVITSPANGEVLKYDGTNWINDTDTSNFDQSLNTTDEVVFDEVRLTSKAVFTPTDPNTTNDGYWRPALWAYNNGSGSADAGANLLIGQGQDDNTDVGPISGQNVVNIGPARTWADDDWMKVYLGGDYVSATGFPSRISLIPDNSETVTFRRFTGGFFDQMDNLEQITRTRLQVRNTANTANVLDVNQNGTVSMDATRVSITGVVEAGAFRGSLFADDSSLVYDSISDSLTTTNLTATNIKGSLLTSGGATIIDGSGAGSIPETVTVQKLDDFITDFKSAVAASTDLADFQSRIAALTYP